jgi:hypothetical protein
MFKPINDLNPHVFSASAHHGAPRFISPALRLAQFLSCLESLKVSGTFNQARPSRPAG